MEQDWNEELFGCCTEPLVCVVASLVPCGICYLQSYAVKHSSKHGAIKPFLNVCCLACIGGAVNREIIRKALNIKGNFTTSLGIWIFFPICAAIQEYNEVASTAIIFLESEKSPS